MRNAATDEFPCERFNHPRPDHEKGKAAKGEVKDEEELSRAAAVNALGRLGKLSL
jgi:hypothetical protein